MARLTITAHARADLREIHSHIAKDNPGAARRFVERLRTTARQLAETPGMGRSRREDLRPDLFSFPVGHYILFYREQPGGPKFTRQVQRRYRPELRWERNMISSTWTSALRCRGFMKPAHRVVRSAGSSGGAPRR